MQKKIGNLGSQLLDVTDNVGMILKSAYLHRVFIVKFSEVNCAKKSAFLGLWDSVGYKETQNLTLNSVLVAQNAK